LFEYLQHYTKSSNFISTNAIIKLFSGICFGLNFIHEADLAHRDLKPQNILLSNNKQEAILTDFGSMTEKNIKIVDSKKRQEIEDWSAQNCSMFYKAPELFSPKVGMVISEKADLWSLGCLLYYLMFNKGPFDYVIEKGIFL
jgi:serine/threonine kinase 16